MSPLQEESGCDEDEGEDEEEGRAEEDGFDSDESLVDSDSDSDEKGVFLTAETQQSNPISSPFVTASQPQFRQIDLFIVCLIIDGQYTDTHCFQKDECQ